MASPQSSESPAASPPQPQMSSEAPPGAATTTAIAHSPPSSTPSSPVTPPASRLPSRRVRLYVLTSSGAWNDWGVGWLWMGDEIPVQAEDQQHRRHILVQADIQADPNAPPHQQAPVGALGLPSLPLPTLLSLHVPHGSGYSTQGGTIVTYTTRFEAQHQRAHQRYQQQQLQAAGATDATAQHSPPGGATPHEGDEIDIALSFQNDHDTQEVLKYIMAFPEVQEQIEEQQRVEAKALADQESEDADDSREESSESGLSDATSDAQQHSPRTMSLYSAEQMDDGPSGPLVRGGWPGHGPDEDDFDELIDPPAVTGAQQQTTSFFSSLSKGHEDDDEPTRRKVARSIVDQGGLGDSDDDDEDSHRSAIASMLAAGREKGSTSGGMRIGRRPATPSSSDSDAHDEDETDEDDLVFPPSLRVPVMGNLGRIHQHVLALLHPPTSPVTTPIAQRNGKRRPNSKAAQQRLWTPMKRRNAFVTAISTKSATHKKNLLISSAKKPIASRARGPSPITTHVDEAMAALPASTTGGRFSPAATAASSCMSSPPPAPVSSSADLNWLENLSVLLRTIDEAISWREESGIDVQRPDGQTVACTAHGGATSMDTNADVPAPAAPVTATLAVQTPESATLATLLSCASQIQEVMSLLFSFNSVPLLNALFDCSSTHAIYYHWFLVLAAYEYESALERKQKQLAVAKANGASTVNSSALWHRHRSYMQSVALKSPFPLSMTHVIDVAVCNHAVASGDPALLAQLTAPPTRFCLLILASYYLQYVRDTLLYSPRTLDDPIQQTMNQHVVFRNLNAVMNALCQDGDSSALQPTITNTGFGFGGGLRRTQSNVRPASAMRRNSGRKGSEEAETPKWTKHVFMRIQQLIDQEEAQHSAPSAQAAVAADAHAEVDLSVPAVASLGVYPVVSRLMRDWCPILPLTSCESLADYMYALHHLFVLTKNANSPNGVTPVQKERFFTKLIAEGLVGLIESVLRFCKRQQARIQAVTSDQAMSAPLPPIAAASSAPAFTSSLSSAATITWLRLLCLDFLTSLQTACPGFLRSFMQPHCSFASDLVRMAGADVGVMSAPTITDDIEEIDTEEKTSNGTTQRTGKATAATPAASLTNPTNKHWKQMHEWCRATRQQFSTAVKTAAADTTSTLTPLQDSLLMMCFQMMADPQVYVGVRQTASSLLRLSLDPEFSRPAEPINYQRLFEEGGGNSGCNPLVALLALGGVGSSAAKQMHFDSETEPDEDADVINELPSNPRRFLRQTFGMDQQGGRRRQQSESEQRRAADRKKAEQKRRRKAVRQRIKQKQKKITDDTMLQLAYAPDARAMEHVIDILRAAADSWATLQATGAPITPAEVAAFVTAYPSALLVDCIDFLSFLSLRHSVVFQEFVLSSGVFDLLCKFFPSPLLTGAELALQAKRAQAIAAAKAGIEQANSEMKVAEAKPSSIEAQPTSSPDSSLPTSSPSPSPLPPTPSPSPPSVAIDAGAATIASTLPTPAVFVPPRVTAPTPVLCATLRFLRICLEIDPVFILPIQSSNLLLCLVELFLQNLRPNLLHSSILEVFTFIDERKISPFVGQLLHGNQYCRHQAAHEARKRSAKLQAKLAATRDGGVAKVDSVPSVPDADADTEMLPATQESNGSSQPPLASVPILPAAPEHSASTADLAPLPYFTSAYGISRVCNLPIWPVTFKLLQSKRRIARTASEALTEVVVDGSPVLAKRRRDEDESSDSDQPQAQKRSKQTTGGVTSFFYSGSELDSSSMSEDSGSDVDTSSTGTSSDNEVDSRGGRRGSLIEEDDDTTMEDDGTHGEGEQQSSRSTHQAYVSARALHERETDADENYFSSWPDDDSPAEQKNQQNSPIGGDSNHRTAYQLHQADPEDDDMFGPAMPSSAGTDTATPANAQASEEDAAADKRLAETQAKMKLQMHQKAEAEDKLNQHFAFKKKTPQPDAPAAAAAASSPATPLATSAASSSPALPSTGTGLLGKIMPFWGNKKGATPAATAAAFSVTTPPAATSPTSPMSWIPNLLHHMPATPPPSDQAP